MTRAEPSRRLVQQRIRNRIIENVEMIAGDGKDPPPFSLAEVVNLWWDWVDDGHAIDAGRYPGPVYTETERDGIRMVDAAIRTFVAAWDAAEATGAVPDDDARALLAWPAVVAAAEAARATLARRGRLPEDGEADALA